MRNEEKKGFSEKELLKYHEAVDLCVCREPYQYKQNFNSLKRFKLVYILSITNLDVFRLGSIL